MRTHSKKFTKFFIIFLLVCVSLLYADTQIIEFHAKRSENNVAILEWITLKESNLKQFDIERSNDGMNWISIGYVTPLTEYSYEKTSYSFTDPNIFKTTQSTFFYRLVIVDKNGHSTIHTVIASISGQSGIKHTWGSIKALFR